MHRTLAMSKLYLDGAECCERKRVFDIERAQLLLGGPSTNFETL